MTSDTLSVPEAGERIAAVFDAIQGSVIVRREFLETVLVGVLGRGHVLLEDVPGTGKTLTAQSVADALGLSFSRVQFTPDLLPSDITGTNVFNENDGSFEFRRGPIFANVVLADEINRAPPKTQAALLEAMAEGQVTVEGETYELPDPFFVIATQNPVESEGTFPLPEAQVDRFAVKNSMGYPDRDGEIELLRRRAGRAEQVPSVETVLEDGELAALQAVPESVHVDPDLLSYIADLCRATREDRRVEVGVSPRGTQRLFELARANAVLRGREFVTPDDIKTIARPALAHRLVLTPEAQVNDVSKAAVLEDVLADVPVPTVDRESSA
ncbi:MoxR family ATPase [Halolamina sp.]|jgi:MoxR-like ATPase|uniref:AAA family ATPase n=1 Tax=Halolamina sp. TaxID=1940283 RepID=UPI000223B6A1|nr:ATPase associated with various cellular activities AAA_3 [halophilic archaeon DL31]